MSPRIAITPRSLSAGGHPELGRLTAAGFELVFPAPGKQPGEAELLTALPGCVGMLAGVEPIGRMVLGAAAPGLKVISRNGVGVDSIDLAAASALGIVIRKADGANARGVAELAIGLMLAASRHVARSDRGVRAGGFERHTGNEVEGRTLGIIGGGNIGRIVARLALGLGMWPLVHDPFVEQASWPLAEVPLVALDDLFSRADVVTLHCPPAGRPLVDAGAISRLRKGAILINTARADLVDPAAVLAGLESGQLAGFATDVYAEEPPRLDALLTHPATILMPHAGGLTRESIERATCIAVDNLLGVLAPRGTA